MGKNTIYIIKDRRAEELINDNDVDGFRNYIAEESYLSVESMDFDSEEEQKGFLAGFFHGCDERAPAGKVALIENIEYYHPFIETLKESCVI